MSPTSFSFLLFLCSILYIRRGRLVHAAASAAAAFKMLLRTSFPFSRVLSLHNFTKVLACETSLLAMRWDVWEGGVA